MSINKSVKHSVDKFIVLLKNIHGYLNYVNISKSLWYKSMRITKVTAENKQ